MLERNEAKNKHLNLWLCSALPWHIAQNYSISRPNTPKIQNSTDITENTVKDPRGLWPPPNYSFLQMQANYYLCPFHLFLFRCMGCCEPWLLIKAVKSAEITIFRTFEYAVNMHIIQALYWNVGYHCARNHQLLLPGNISCDSLSLRELQGNNKSCYYESNFLPPLLTMQSIRTQRVTGPGITRAGRHLGDNLVSLIHSVVGETEAQRRTDTDSRISSLGAVSGLKPVSDSLAFGIFSNAATWSRWFLKQVFIAPQWDVF